MIQTRGDIIIDSPSKVEDIERVLCRLGMLTDSRSPALIREPNCHMTHADIYCCMFDTIIQEGISYCKVLRLEGYISRNVYTME